MMMERKGRAESYFDELDVMILRFIDNKKDKPTITEIKNHVGLTHSNLIKHLNKLEFGTPLVPPLLKRDRDKQTIFISFTEPGKELMKIFREAWNRGKESKDIDDLKKKAKEYDNKLKDNKN